MSIEPWMVSALAGVLGVGVTWGAASASLRNMGKQITDHIAADEKRWDQQDKRDGRQEDSIQQLRDRGMSLMFVPQCERLRELCRNEWKEDIAELKTEMKAEFALVRNQLEKNRSDLIDFLKQASSDVEAKRIAREQHPVGYSG